MTCSHTSFYGCEPVSPHGDHVPGRRPKGHYSLHYETFMKLSYRPSLVLAATVVYALVTAGCDTSTAAEGNGPPPPPPTSPPSGGIQVALVDGTYVGGAGFEEGREPIVLPGGRLLFGARTFSTTMPATAGALQGTYGGGTADSWLGILNSAGTGFEAATYFGGSGMERPPYGIVVMGNGDIVFTSATESTNLPTTSGAYRTALNSPVTGGYVCRVTQSLTTIQWCTYIAGWPRGGLGLAANQDIYVVGSVTPGATFTATDGGQIVLKVEGSSKTLECPAHDRDFDVDADASILEIGLDRTAASDNYSTQGFEDPDGGKTKQTLTASGGNLIAKAASSVLY